MTYFMPSTVSDVSAMFVLTMHLRVPCSAPSKICGWIGRGQMSLIGMGVMCCDVARIGGNIIRLLMEPGPVNVELIHMEL